MPTKTEYRAARRLIRDNGRWALHWIDCEKLRETMREIEDNRLAVDQLALRASMVRYCQRENMPVTFAHLINDPEPRDPRRLP